MNELRMWYAGDIARIRHTDEDMWRVFWNANGIRFSSVPYPSALEAQHAILGTQGRILTIDTEMDMDLERFQAEQKLMDLEEGKRYAKDMCEMNPHYTHDLTRDIIAEAHATGIERGRA